MESNIKQEKFFPCERALALGLFNGNSALEKICYYKKMYYIIANLLSGKGAGKKCLETAEKFLTQNNLPFKTEIINGHGSGRALAQKACQEAKDAQAQNAAASTASGSPTGAGSPSTKF